MKFDTSKKVLDRSGIVLVENGDEITMGKLCVRALDSIIPGDEHKTIDKTRKMFNLATKLADGGVVSLNHEEAIFLQERVCIYSSLIAGQIIRELDGE